MLKQVEKTYTYNGEDGPYNYPADWFPTNVAGYDTIALTITAPDGWDGTISFWGGAAPNQESPALWSLNDAEDSSLVSQVETVVGATPSAFAKNYRGSVAGLAEFGIYLADSSYVSVVGTDIKISVGLYASAK